MSIRKAIIQYLEGHESYFRFKYSKLVYGVVQSLNPALKRNIEVEQILFQEILADMPANALVFDIGASVGNTMAIFLNLGAKVIAVEPDPKNLRCLRARFEKNKNVNIVSKAVSNELTKTTLYVQEDGNTLHTLSDKWKTYLESPQNNRWQKPIAFSKKITIPTVTLDELIAQFGKPSFIKIDVEGFEEQVIKSLSQKIPMLSFEANLPEFLSETLNAIDHLKRLDAKATFNYVNAGKVMLEHYVEVEEIETFLKTTELRYLDVLCRMA